MNEYEVKKNTRGRFRPLHACLAGMLCLALGEAALAQDQPKVSMQLEPADVIGLEERALLRLRIEGAGSGRPNPTFKLDNFKIAAGPSQSTSLTIINGVPSSSLTLTWSLQPLAVGKARIYGGKVRIGNTVLDLPDRQIEVAAESPAGRAPRNDPFSGRRDPFFDRGSPLEEFFGRSRRRPQRQRPQAAPRVFLQAVVDTPSPWVGEQVLYTLYLFTEVDVQSINPEELPEFNGFWSRTIPQPERIQPEIVTHEGQRIYRFPLLERALFPRRAGTFEIPEVEASMDAMVRDSDIFGSLLPRARQITRKSNAVTVEVRELPPPPPGFQGVVGQISLEGSLSPSALEVGDAATLTLTLSGRGHLQGVPAPRLPELQAVETFPPQQQSDESLRGKRVSGTRTWSYVLVPQRPGDWQLPPIEIPYFDPRRGSYQVARVDDLGLAVRGTTSAEQQTGQTVELHSIRTAALPVVAGSSFQWRSVQPWLFGIPWALAVLFLGVRRLEGRDSGTRQSRKDLLRRLRAAAAEERPRQAAAEVEEAWREFLQQRWHIPQGTPSTQWGPLLVEQGARPDPADELVKLADDLHYLRYAPKLSSTAELRKELIERSRKLARALR